MTRIVRRYKTRNTRDNPIILPLIALAGAAIVGYLFVYKPGAKLLGGEEKLAVVVPPLAAAGVTSFYIKPKVGKRIGKHLDYVSLGLVSVAALGAVWPAKKPPPEEGAATPEMTRAVMTRIGIGGDVRPVIETPRLRINIDPVQPGIYWDEYKFKVTSLAPAPLNLFWKIEGARSWAETAMPVEWKRGQVVVAPGQFRVFTPWISTPSGTPTKFRIVIAADESFAPEKTFVVTPWYYRLSGATIKEAFEG